jgi:hypothetical protein
MNSPDLLDVDIPTICLVMHISKQEDCFVDTNLYSVPVRRAAKTCPTPPEKQVIGIFINGINGGTLYPAIRNIAFSEGRSLLEEIQDIVENGRRGLLCAKMVPGGYPSGNADKTVQDMNHLAAASISIEGGQTSQAKRRRITRSKK